MPDKYEKGPGPCPDPDKFILVQPKKGPPYWRRKRGTIKPAGLNDVFRKNVQNSKMAGPAAKRVVKKLHPFLRDLIPGRLTVNLTAAFIKALNQKGRVDFSFLEGCDMHEHPLWQLLPDRFCKYKVENEQVTIHIRITPQTIKRRSIGITDYYFEAILLYGDATKNNSLRVSSEMSPLYQWGNYAEDCYLTLDLPAQKQPWMALLKTTCQQANRPDSDPRHSGMMVVAVGEGEC